MNCPECNHQNPDDATICEKCYLNFSLVRTSKLATLSMILGLSSLFLFVITGIPAIVLGIISIVKINKSKGLLTGKGLARGGINLSLVLMFVFFLVWRVDAPPITNDYTTADLRSAPAEYEESYHLLVKLTDRNSNFLEQTTDSNNSDTGLSKDDIEFIREFNDNIYDNTLEGNFEESQNAYAEKIELLWKRTEKAREIIRKINKFPEIADLFEPDQTEQIRIFPLNNLATLYMNYIYLQNTPEEIDTITNELIEMDSVFRKLSINARLYSTKIICYVCMENNILCANIISNKTNTNKNSLEKLFEHFTPFTTEQLTLQNVILADYMRGKNLLLNISEKDKYAKYPIFKKYSTIRWYRNFLVDYLNNLPENNTKGEFIRIWPTFYPINDRVYDNSKSSYNIDAIPFYYKLYNPLGALLASKLSVQYGPSSNIYNLISRSDLLIFILNKRLGKENKIDSENIKIDLEKKEISISNKRYKHKNVTLPFNPKVNFVSEYNSWFNKTVRM